MTEVITDNDLEVLLEALDSWIYKGFDSLMMTSFIKAAVVQNTPEAKQDFEREEDKRKKQYE